MENGDKPLLPSALGVLTHVPKKIDQIEDFVKSMYRVDKHIDMKTIYKSPLDIARLHVIEDDYRRHGLLRSANVLKVFLDIFKPASVSKDGIGREQAKDMIQGLLARQTQFSENLAQLLTQK